MKRNPIAIIIRGAGFSNKGAEAMLLTVQRELAIRMGESSFFVCCSSRDESLAWAGGFVPVPYPEARLASLLGRWLGPRAHVCRRLFQRADILGMFRSLYSFSRVRQEVYLREVNKRIGFRPYAVMDVSGYLYGDTWSVKPMLDTTGWIRSCRNDAAHYVFLPQAWGPFGTDVSVNALRRMLEGASLYYARDSVSREFLAGAVHRPLADVPQKPDIAFKFVGLPKGAGETILRQAGHDFGAGRPTVGVAPNIRVWERCKGSGLANEYVARLVKLCDSITAGLGASVVLIPNEIQVPGEACVDDQHVCGLIRSAVRDRSRCVALTGYHSADAIKSVTASLDFLVGARFHTLVFALSQAVPCMAVSWSPKYRELLAPFGLGRYVVEQDALAGSDMWELFHEAWGRREALRSAIAAVQSSMAAELDAMFDEVAETIARPAGRTE